MISRSNIYAHDVKVGDWIQTHEGVARLVATLESPRENRLRIGFVDGKYLYKADRDLVNVLLGVADGQA
jgi:hypothetical protein